MSNDTKIFFTVSTCQHLSKNAVNKKKNDCNYPLNSQSSVSAKSSIHDAILSWAWTVDCHLGLTVYCVLPSSGSLVWMTSSFGVSLRPYSSPFSICVSEWYNLCTGCLRIICIPSLDRIFTDAGRNLSSLPLIKLSTLPILLRPRGWLSSWMMTTSPITMEEFAAPVMLHGYSLCFSVLVNAPFSNKSKNVPKFC